LSEPKAGGGPQKGHAHEPAKSIDAQIDDVIRAGQYELQKMSLKGQWRTKRVVELEVKRLLAANAAQECTIQSLCARVAELERNKGMCAREIPSVVQSKPILENEAHFRKLEDNPEWALILYLEYGDDQKRNLIYQHLHMLLDQLRGITGGDAMKAKQLGDLMYLRLHAGEERRQDTVQKWRVQAKPVRVLGVQLEEVRSCARGAVTAAPTSSAAHPRLKIFEQSLLEIRSEMLSNDDWEVETAVQYRVKYGKELRLSKCKGVRR
jgi:hypothetical protein